MSFETKKLNLIKLILSINDEKTIDRITNFIGRFFNVSDKAEASETVDLTPFIATIDTEFDLEKITKAQNYQQTSDEEMEAIIAKINIEEPLEELLEMLD
jgi:F0F1-type ATP synthase gamma subunit